VTGIDRDRQTPTDRQRSAGTAIGKESARMNRGLLLGTGLGIGTVLGFGIAHLVSRTTGGARFFDGLNGRLRGLGDAMRAGYREREAQLRAAVGDAEAQVAALDT
jgi:hypothetical protein